MCIIKITKRDKMRDLSSVFSSLKTVSLMYEEERACCFNLTASLLSCGFLNLSRDMRFPTM